MRGVHPEVVVTEAQQSLITSINFYMEVQWNSWTISTKTWFERLRPPFFFSFLKKHLQFHSFHIRPNGSHESQHPKHLLSFIGEAKLPTSKYIPVHLYGSEGSRPEKDFFLNFPFLFGSSRRWVILFASLRQRSFHFNSAFLLCKWFVVRNHSGKQPKSDYGWAQMKP